MRMGGAGARSAARNINKKKTGAMTREQREIQRYGLVENKNTKEIDPNYLKQYKDKPVYELAE